MTDALIINVRYVVPRVVFVVALRVLGVDALDVGGASLEHLHAAVSMACFVVAFAVVEVVVPWRTGGNTPAGLFYRMSCETQERTGADRALFYGLRAVVLFLVLRSPLFAAPSLALFYLSARNMPYDFIPSNPTCDDRDDVAPLTKAQT